MKIYLLGQGLADFFNKGQKADISGFVNHVVSVTILISAAVEQKRPETIHKQISIAMFQ